MLPDRRGHGPARGGHGALLWLFTVVQSGPRTTSAAFVFAHMGKRRTGLEGFTHRPLDDLERKLAGA
jgi:hypothetical protein